MSTFRLAFGFLILALMATTAFPQEQFTKKRYVNVKQENLRSSPNGEKIGALFHGAAMEELERQGNWAHVSLKGWVWIPSLSDKKPAPMARTSHDLKIESWKWVNEKSMRHIRIEGVVQNNSDNYFKSARINITAKDANGNLLGMGDAYLKPSTIGPGGSSNFTVYIDDALCSTSSLRISYTFDTR